MTPDISVTTPPREERTPSNDQGSQFGLLQLPSDPDTLIPANAISQYTGIARQTHNRWRHEGAGPRFVRLGRRVFYRVADLREWIRASVRQNTINAD